MKVQIIVDSTTNNVPAVLERLRVVPLTVRFGQEEYIDGVTITNRAFYEKLTTSDVMPTTSQATPAAFQAVFEQVAAAGDSAVVLTLSGKLSGTYQSAVIASADYDHIYVVDADTAAIGTGILVELALQLADSGMDAEQIARTLEQEKEKIRIIAVVDTLEYLKRGGRISRTVAFAGDLLNIKPVLAVEAGQIRILGKARGSKQGNNLLTQQIKACGVDFEKPVLLGYTGLSDALLNRYIEDSRELWTQAPEPLRSTCIGSVIGTHAGPGAIAVAFFQK